MEWKPCRTYYLRVPPRRVTVRVLLLGVATALLSSAAGAQAPGKFPPDSLVNVRVIPKATPVIQVVGTMRNFAGNLGVRCQFCHVGEEGMPLERFDFASDQKRTKLIAREMMRMGGGVTRRLVSLPGRASPPVRVPCAPCKRGGGPPMPLPQVIREPATAAGA